MILVMVALALGGGCALHEDLVLVDDRVAGLYQKTKKAEADIAALRAEIKRCHEEDEAFRSMHAELHALVNDVRDEMRGLRGQIEESRYEAKHSMIDLADIEARREERGKNLEKLIKSSLDRIIQIEQYVGMEPSEKLASSEAEETVADKEKEEAAKAPDELYLTAKQRFDRGEHEAARELFQDLLKQYPKSVNADNAQFWIGEIYYREKWYEKAILEYQKVIEKHPNGNKVQSAFLKQGMAFLNLGDKANARLILKELVRKYPDSREAKIAKENLKTLQ
ncbi:MAG: tol-pal system protein YbgF [Desulfobacterales bacterium]|nr:tol-pal system protein YbgF [Desulfobacterales bacterium]